MAQDFASILQKLLNERINWQHQVIADWAQIIGPMHQRVRVEKIENDILILGVFDAAWMHELSMLTDVLKDKINRFLGAPYIKSVRLRRVAPHQRTKRTVNAAPKRSLPPKPLSIHEQTSLRAIRDPELKKTLVAFRDRCFNQ